MEKKENYRKETQEFISFMYQKGYRGRFHLMRVGTGRPQTMGSLRSVMETQLNDYLNSATKRPMFELKTYADQSEKIECRFKILLTETKGFQVQQMDVLDTRSRQQFQFHIRSNHEIAGAIAVQGLFPNRKPWDDYLKGKFRL